MGTWRWGVALGACAAASMIALPLAHAAADGGDAKALMQAGAEQFTRKQYDAARESFAQAYALDPQPATLLDLALAELQTNRPVEAAAHFRAYLARPDAAEDKRGAVQAKWLPRAEAQLGRVQLVVPSGAQVLVDGKPAAADPSLGVFEVVAGDHDIAAVSAGRSETEHVTASAGATVTMRMLVDDPAASPALAAPLGPTTLESPEESPPASSPSASRIATALSLGGAALVGVGLGIGFGLAASSKASAIEGGEGCMAGNPMSYACQYLSYDVSVEHRYEWVSIGSTVGAGVLGAAGLATWFFWPRAPARVSALVDGRQVGLGLEGRWGP